MHHSADWNPNDIDASVVSNKELCHFPWATYCGGQSDHLKVSIHHRSQSFKSQTQLSSTFAVGHFMHFINDYPANLLQMLTHEPTRQYCLKRLWSGYQYGRGGFLLSYSLFCFSVAVPHC